VFLFATTIVAPALTVAGVTRKAWLYQEGAAGTRLDVRRFLEVFS
jgi:hypothetical protein